MIITDRTAGPALERIARCTSVTWDLETTGLKPYHGDRLFSVAVEADGAVTYWPFRHLVGENLPAGRLSQLLDALTSADELVGFNSVRFDAPMVVMEGERYERVFLRPHGVRHRDVIIDAMLANENEPSYSLDNLGQKYLGGDVATKRQHKARLLEALKRANPGVTKQKDLWGKMATLPPELVAPYAEGDVIDTRALATKYEAHHKAWGLTALAREMYAYARLLARCERRGLRVDAVEAERRVTRLAQEQVVLLAAIRDIAGFKYNPNSPVQNAKLFGSGVAKDILKSGHPLAHAVVEWKRMGKMSSTYYQAMLDLMDANGVIHPQMNLTRDPRDVGGTRSCRLSCSNPNFQNLPKHAQEWYMRVRELVLARPGHRLLALDYERAEMWVGGHYSNDDALVDAYVAGRDLYQEYADRAGITRQQGKILWLAIQYGIGAEKLSKNFGWPFVGVPALERRFGIPAAEWKDAEWGVYFAQKGPIVKREFFKMCPGIKAMMDTLTERANTVGSMRLFTGRIIHCDHNKTLPFAMWNRLIQGTVGEQMRQSMQRLEDALDAECPGTEQILQVHDEVAMEALDEHAPKASKLAADIMCDFPQFKLRPRVELSSGLNYGNLLKEAA